MTQAFTESAAVADKGFWPAAAAEALHMAGRAGAATPADLRSLDVVLPSWNHAPLLRRALHERLFRDGYRGCLPPRMFTVETWAGDAHDGTVERRIGLFDALRANAWIRSSFGTQAAALWALAAHIDALCEELTLAAVGGPEAFEARLQASLMQHFHHRAARALQPQAQLVLQIWRAGLTHGGGLHAGLAALQARTREATRPLLCIASPAAPAWMRAWLATLAERVPVHLLQKDVRGAVAARPLLAAAWPELMAADVDPAPIVERARQVGAPQALAAPVLLEAHTLEDEAIAICEQVLTWLRPKAQADLFSTDVPRSIALVALDRLAARRTRALLERAQVLVRDETGWKLSTTSAAGVVMRLFDLGTNGFHHRDLLDWLKSPFTLAGLAGKAYLIETIEKVIRARGIVQGLGAIVLALHEKEPADGEDGTAGANRWLQTLEAHASRLGAGAATMAAFVQTLADALVELGMRAPLAADPVGAEVLRVLDDLRARVLANRDAGGVKLAAAEFRALIAARFEEIAVAAGAVDSPVAMVSLSAAALRDFDAAILIGVDAAHLPTLPSELLFLSNAVRDELGLGGTREALRTQAEDLATLLARVPQVVAIWCSRADNEPRPLAAPFARLRAVARAAGHDPLRPARSTPERVDATPTMRPAPVAPDRLGRQISATGYQSLVNCPYQFYARHMLRLRALEDVTDEPSPTEYGKAVHEVLAAFHLHWRDVDLRRANAGELAASLTQHADAVFAPLIERRPRLVALRRQFADTQDAYLGWLRKRLNDGWSFQAAEADTTVAFDVDGVRSLDLVGRLDRIDVRGEDVEVLDYKVRRRQQLGEDLASAGESVQLPFYGLLLSGKATRASFVFLQRTSDRQDQVGVVSPRQPYAPLVAALRVRLRHDLQRIAAGARLPALGNEEVCSWCEMRGLCRRDFWQDADEEP